MDKKLYTIIVYSENYAGILSQIASVFTRQQVNIESFNVSASSVKDIHRYTITAWSKEEQVVKITKQIERKIDVVKADYYVDEQLFIHETALYKISTPVLLENPELSRIIRRSGVRVLEVNSTYSTLQIAGMSDDLHNLYNSLNRYGCLLQYSRSGRVAVTRSMEEPLAGFLAKTGLKNMDTDND